MGTPCHECEASHATTSTHDERSCAMMGAVRFGPCQTQESTPRAVVPRCPISRRRRDRRRRALCLRAAQFRSLLHRYYDPATGQFLSLDPLVAATTTPYVYVTGDPVNFLDPLGLGLLTDIGHVFNPCDVGNVCHHVHNVADGSRHTVAHLLGITDLAVGFHPATGLKGAANFAAGFANFAVSTLTLGHVTVPAPFCGGLLGASYDIGKWTALVEAGLAGGAEADAAKIGVEGSSEQTVVNLGGEGEVPGAINQQPASALEPEWGASRTEVAGKSLTELQALGEQYVVADNSALPFAATSIDQVITNSVPIDIDTPMGPGIQSSEIWRILKSGGTWIDNGVPVTWPW
jgi:hypothetical protein